MKNNMLNVKFCGISKPEDIKIAINLNVKWVGLIFVKNTPRYVNFDTSDFLINSYRNMINFVGVFVNPENKELDRAIASGINTIQLHGEESPERCLNLKKSYNLPIIKAFPISDFADLKNVKNYKDCCDIFLFDAKAKEENDNIGGNGRIFDWNIIKNNSSWINNMKPWILSGGLNKKNVLEALKLTNAKSIDVSSGIEKKLGDKNHNMMKEFIDKLKNL